MKLRVWYGLRKLTEKVIKKPSIIIVFENGYLWRNDQSINRMMKVLHIRYQTEDEVKDAEGLTRVFTIWEIFLQDRKFNGDVEQAIAYNRQCDINNVQDNELDEIEKKIKNEIYEFYNIKKRIKNQLSLFE